MTKAKMLNFIEKTGVVVNFNRKYLMRWDKKYIKRLYDMAIIYDRIKNMSC